MLDNIADERKSFEVEALKKIEREDKCLADQRAFELEKLKLQAQNPPASVGNSSQMDSNPMRLDLKTVLPTLIPDKDDISLFLTMFERQMKLLNVPADFWISHLIGVLPSDIGRNTGNPEFRKSHSFKVEKNVSGNHNSAFANPSYMPARNTNTGFYPPIPCYGCGNPGFNDELIFKFLRNRGQKFSEFHLAMCLADGQQSTSLVQKATVPITVGGRTFQIDLIFLQHAKDDSPVEINSSSCPTNSIPSEIPLHSNTVDEAETNDLHLREEEGNVEERNDLMVLLNESKDVFRLGGEPTPFVKHFINTGDHPPVSTAPYRLSPNRKEHLRKEIDNLLADNIIEECESP
ncbi:transposon Ty3-I Gag-Pol polyprotein [Trichonephila clavipes]|nr:transposon Ty3-I Gag-Pol polyprotein [Trichonephila clavipes]